MEIANYPFYTDVIHDWEYLNNLAEPITYLMR